MNERIRALAEQAGLFADLDGNPWPRALSAEESVAAYNKFSELIVRECAEVQMKRSCDRHGYDKYEDAKEIKEHFGVEE